MLYFIFLFFYLIRVIDPTKKSRYNIYQLNYNFLFFCIAIYGLSELLSLINCFTIAYINATLVIGIISVFSFSVRRILFNLNWLILSLTKIFKKFKVEITILILLFSGAILYSPNNYDSNMYHLPRIIHWLQNNNLSHYATPIYFQLYQPIFSELNLTWIYSSFGPISLLNCLQLLFFGFLYSMVWLIFCELLKIIKYQNIIYVFLIIFSLLLQAENTKNDVILTYFLFIFIYGLVNLFMNMKVDKIFLIMGLFLAIFTKGTSYIYLFSLILISVFYLIIHFKKYSDIFRIIFKLDILLILSFGFVLWLPLILRNYNLSGNFTGQDNKELTMYTNQNQGIKPMISNGLKNVSMHINLPNCDFRVTEKVNLIHQKLKLPSINDSNYNFCHISFQVYCNKLKKCFTADSVSNYVWFWLNMMFVILWILYPQKMRSPIILFYFGSIIMLLVFSFLLKWQPWHTRLLIPFFLLNSVALVVFINKFRIFVLLKRLILLNGIICIVLNGLQPIIVFGKITGNYKYSFSYYDRLPAYWVKVNEYEQINNMISDNKKIGLVCNSTELVFPFMWNYRNTHNNFTYSGIIDNPSRRLVAPIDLDYLIVDKTRVNSQVSGYTKTYENSKWILYKN
jgi:hypothetical protein